MKKTNLTILLALLLSLCLLFAGCNGSTEPGEETTEDSAKDGEITTTAGEDEADKPLAIGYSPAAAGQSGRFCPDGKGGLYYRDAATGALSHAKADGSEKTVLSERTPLFINMVGETVFFLDESAGNALCAVSASGGEVTVLAQTGAKALFAIGDKLYYSDAYAMYVMNTDGNGNHKLLDGATPVGYHDGMLYYTDADHRLFRYALAGGEKTQLTDEAVNTVTVNENGVFFLNNESQAFSWLKEDGNILPLINGMSLYLIDGKTLYFKDMGSGMYYRLGIESEQATPLAAFSRLFFTSDGVPKPADQLDLSNAGAIYSEDGNYLYALEGNVYVYATLGEAMKTTGKAECLTVWKDSGFVIW